MTEPAFKLDDEHDIAAPPAAEASPSEAAGPPRPWLYQPFVDLWHHRNLIRALVITNERATFHRSALGLAWKYIEPAFFVFTYYVFIVIVRHSGDMHLIAVIMSGLMIYQWTQKSLMASCTVLLTYRGLATTTSLPLICLMGGGFYQNVQSTAPLWLMATLTIALGYHLPDLYILGVPLLLLLLGWCLLPLCIIMAYIGSYFHDLHRVLEMVLRIAIFISPVLFEASYVPPHLHWVITFNPMAYFIGAIRDLMWRGTLPSLKALLVILGCSLVLWGIALMMLQRVGRQVAKVL